MSLKLLYTGVTKAGDPQNDPSASTGFYISGTEIPNGQINALFPSIPQQLEEGSSSRILRAIAIYNPTANPITDIDVYYEQNSQQPVSRYLMGVTAPALDDCNDPYFEKVSNENALPSNVSFVNNRESGNAITIPSIAANSYLGLWMVREVSSNRVNAALGECQVLFDRFEAGETSSEITIETVADSNDSLDGESFMLYAPNGKRYFCWIDITGNNSLNIGSIENIVFDDIVTNDTANNIANKIQAKLDDVLGFDDVATVTVDTNVITIQFTNNGPIVSPSAANSSFTFNVTQGTSNNLEQQENISLILSW